MPAISDFFIIGADRSELYVEDPQRSSKTSGKFVTQRLLLAAVMSTYLDSSVASSANWAAAAGRSDL